MATQCLVSAADYKRHFEGGTAQAYVPPQPEPWNGVERRVAQTPRRASTRKYGRRFRLKDRRKR